MKKALDIIIVIVLALIVLLIVLGGLLIKTEPVQGTTQTRHYDTAGLTDAQRKSVTEYLGKVNP